MRKEVLNPEKVGGGFTGGVRIVGAERAKLGHGEMLGSGIAIGNARTDENDSCVDFRRLHRFKQVQRAADLQHGPALRRRGGPGRCASDGAL